MRLKGSAAAARWAAIAAFSLAIVGLILWMWSGLSIFVAATISASFTGSLFLSLHAITVLLSEIRDALRQDVAEAEAEVQAESTPARPVRNLASLDADLARLRAKHDR